MHAYDAKDLKRLFDLPASAVRSLARAGHLTPVRRAGRLHYSFQDLVVLRTASALRAAKIPAQRINRTLQTLRATMPAGATLNKLSLMALGNQIAIREGKLLWESDTGQYVLALDISEEQGGLHVINRENSDPASINSADEFYAKAFSLEDSDPSAARAAYEACLKADDQHIEARINLGRLLHLAGKFEEAEEVYRAADSAEPLLTFNLAVLLEDLNREPDAIEAYREALALDPQMADAHFNLARLYERAKDPRASLRHLLAYRRMIGRQGT
jgi:tetratricopeptide (TPR) repeat protein